jgi:3-oxoacyl-[acyl-carrier protein] reductase
MTRVLEGRYALVTGAADGIGRGIVDMFTAQGATVVAVDIQGDKLHQAHRENEAVRRLVMDITDRDAPERMRRFVEQEIGGLDILVNNAGISGDFVLVQDASDDIYRRVMGVNVEAPFRVTREFVPLLAKHRRGRIISTGSVCSHFAMRYLGVYTMSKHAVLGMMKAFALELGPFGITSNNIEPGNTVTGITRDVFPDANSEKGKAYISQTCVLDRYGQPNDLAGAALYLASDQASFVTGQAISVDGGMTCALFSTPL